MKKISLFVLGVFTAITQITAQNNKYNKIYYKNPQPEKTTDYTILFEDINAKIDYAKLKIKITNHTADYLVFRPNEVSFIYKEGEFKAIKNLSVKFSRESIVIPPYESIT